MLARSRVMTEMVKYKKPRRINVVSVSLALLVAFGIYMGVQWLPQFLQKQEAFRVLEETGSKFSKRRSLYINHADKAEALRRQMANELRRTGVEDPEMETWIEIDEHEARLGVLYSSWLEWPFDVVARTESIQEIEHVVEF